MYKAECLEVALRVAKQAGYEIRHEWLGGSGGGGCELKGKRLLFVDLALGPDEQLDQVLASLRRDGAVPDIEVPAPLCERLGMRKIA